MDHISIISKTLTAITKDQRAIEARMHKRLAEFAKVLIQINNDGASLEQLDKVSIRQQNNEEQIENVEDKYTQLEAKIKAQNIKYNRLLAKFNALELNNN